MKGFHGLLSELTTLLVILSLLVTALPVNAYADDLKNAKALNDEGRAQKELEFKGKKSFYGNLSDAVAKTYQADHFWPVIIGSIGSTALVYYHRQYGLSAYFDDLHRLHKVWRAKPENVAALKNYARGELSQLQTGLETIAKQRIAAAEEMKGLLETAAGADAKLAYDAVPAEARSLVEVKPLPQGATATTSLEQLIESVNKLNAVNGAEYAMLKKLAAEYEKQIGHSPFRFDHRFVNPDDYMIEAHNIATKTHNPRALSREITLLRKAIEKELDLVIGAIPKKGPVWWAKTWRFTSRWSGYGFFTETALGRAISGCVLKSIKLTWPLLITVGVPLLAITYIEHSAIKADEKRREMEAKDRLRDARNADQEKYAFTLVEDSLLLSAELAWQEIRDRYPDEPFAKEDAHYRVGDPIGQAWVKAAWTSAAISAFASEENPYDRNNADDKKADELIKTLCEQLNIEVPDTANRLNSRFYRIFWLDLIAKATEMPGGESLKNMPDKRDLMAERELGAERPKITKQELAHDLAIMTPYALVLASVINRKARMTNEEWIKLDPEKAEKIFKAMDEVEPGMSQRYRSIIAERKAKKEASERDEKDLLPLDPQTQEQNADGPKQEAPEPPATEPAPSSEEKK